jgi:lipopolysaccharide transport system permease protein
VNAVSASVAGDPAQSLHVIEPRKPSSVRVLKEAWEFRDLLLMLVWRDLKVRYKQTYLGPVWVVLAPVMAMLVTSLVFGRLAKLPSDHLPYPLLVFSGLIPWTYFSRTLNNAAGSILDNTALVRKVYFPLFILPLSTALSGLPDLGVSLVVLLALQVWYHVLPGWSLLWLPLVLAWATIMSLGFSIWVASLTAYYRDLRYLISSVLQIWMFVTPIFYSDSLIPEHWRALYDCNPLADLIGVFRQALLGTSSTLPTGILAGCIVGSVLLFVTGISAFQQARTNFVDVA